MKKIVVLVAFIVPFSIVSMEKTTQDMLEYYENRVFAVLEPIEEKQNATLLADNFESLTTKSESQFTEKMEEIWLQKSDSYITALADTIEKSFENKEELFGPYTDVIANELANQLLTGTLESLKQSNSVQKEAFFKHARVLRMVYQAQNKTAPKFKSKKK